VTTLRARQKEDRRKRIIASAKILFRDLGFAKTTIEGIADAAGVSGVTVHNYFGAKAGVLLALVIENDALLIERLEASLPDQPDDLTTLVLQFAGDVMDHAIANLDKVIWREVIAAVATGAGTPLAKAYFKLDQQLAFVLVRGIERLQTAGKLPAAIDAGHLGKALFHLQNARFTQFISSPDCSREEIEARLRNDLAALFAVGAAPSRPIS
jgi:AcrR family transcriptional regulator